MGHRRRPHPVVLRWGSPMKRDPIPEDIFLGWKECDIDHDHKTAWWCNAGPNGVWKPPNIQRDVLRLIEAIERMAPRVLS